jgi:hypothetical protein
MTMEELNDLIARGAAQAGVADAIELMRLGEELNRQAQDLENLYGTAWTSAATGNTNVADTRQRL